MKTTQNKTKKCAYEAPRTDIVIVEQTSVLMASAPTPSMEGMTGDGFQFGTSNGQW